MADMTPNALPTLWGLDPLQLYTRYWAALGVQVVRLGEPSQIVSHAELYLLTEARPLTLFSLAGALDALNWIKPLVLFVRLRDPRPQLGRAGIVADGNGRVSQFTDLDEAADMCRVALTGDIEVARLWQSAPAPRAGWRRLRRYTPRHDRMTLTLAGRVYDRRRNTEIALFMRDLQQTWRRPDAVITRTVSGGHETWRDQTARIESSARLIGPAWIGAGRRVSATAPIVGPAVFWDDPAARPATEPIQWLNIEPVAQREQNIGLWKNARRILRGITRS